MIEMKNIFSGYGKETIINDISLKIPQGKLISVIGPNGSGKSTLLKTMAGIVTATSGEIIINNKAIVDLSRQDIAKEIAYLAQGKSVPDMTVEQMVLHGRFPHLKYPRRYTENDHEIAINSLKQMGIDQFAGKPLATLSGGMRQNAYIAMALAQNTNYILLDEPTTYLDISNQIELMKTLRSLADSGRGIVTVMHDLPLTFRFSDNIIVLKNGRISMCDTPENICKSGIIEDVFGVTLQYCATENYYHYTYELD